MQKKTRLITLETKVDSREGIEYLIEWAKTHRVILSPSHKRIARKYGISTDEVVISYGSGTLK